LVYLTLQVPVPLPPVELGEAVGDVLGEGDEPPAACDVGAWRDVVAVATGSYQRVVCELSGRRSPG
jgi:hypothetical protein